MHAGEITPPEHSVGFPLPLMSFFSVSSSCFSFL